MPQLRIALLEYLKGDNEVYPLVALRFCLFREIAENHESSARKALNDLNISKSANKNAIKEKLEEIMYEFIFAEENYSKASCHTHAEWCAKWAQLVALQINYLNGNIVVINLKSDEVLRFIESCASFYEVLCITRC